MELRCSLFIAFIVAHRDPQGNQDTLSAKRIPLPRQLPANIASYKQITLKNFNVVNYYSKESNMWFNWSRLYRRSGVACRWVIFFLVLSP